MRTAPSIILPGLMTIPAHGHGGMWFWNVTDNGQGFRHGVPLSDYGKSNGPRTLELAGATPTKARSANASPAKLGVGGNATPGPLRPRLKIRALIVEDEPIERERIRLLLRDEPDIELLPDCPNGAAALAAIKRRRPDLLFLDVQMPDQDGFEVLRAIPPDHRPVVIVITGHDQHALRAFDAHAFDYLLKPFKQERFKEALQRVREYFASKQPGRAARGDFKLINHRPYLTRLVVKTGKKSVIIKTTAIDSIESAGNYIAVQSGKESYILRETLNALETRLDPEKFLRISRSAIVNLDRVQELQPMFRGEHVMVLHNGKRLAMTRSLREVEEALKFS